MYVLDAGISGGEEAGAGTLLTMVGGSGEAVETAWPVLDAFSKEVLHAGPLGAGMALKLGPRNATGYSMMAAVHEAMLLAVRAGWTGAAAAHHHRDGRAEAGHGTVRPRRPRPAARRRDRVVVPRWSTSVRLGDKDLAHALDLAGRFDVDLPVTETTRRTWPAVRRLEGLSGPHFARRYRWSPSTSPST